MVNIRSQHLNKSYWYNSEIYVIEKYDYELEEMKPFGAIQIKLFKGK